MSDLWHMCVSTGMKLRYTEFKTLMSDLSHMCASTGVELRCTRVQWAILWDPQVQTFSSRKVRSRLQAPHSKVHIEVICINSSKQQEFPAFSSPRNFLRTCPASCLARAPSGCSIHTLIQTVQLVAVHSWHVFLRDLGTHMHQELS